MVQHSLLLPRCLAHRWHVSSWLPAVRFVSDDHLMLTPTQPASAKSSSRSSSNGAVPQGSTNGSKQPDNGKSPDLSGLHVPRGSILCICPMESHHDPHLYPEEPWAFNPDRYSRQVFNAMARLHDKECASARNTKFVQRPDSVTLAPLHCAMALCLGIAADTLLSERLLCCCSCRAPIQGLAAGTVVPGVAGMGFGGGFWRCVHSAVCQPRSSTKADIRLQVTAWPFMFCVSQLDTIM